MENVESFRGYTAGSNPTGAFCFFEIWIILKWLKGDDPVISSQIWHRLSFFTHPKTPLAPESYYHMPSLKICTTITLVNFYPGAPIYDTSSDSWTYKTLYLYPYSKFHDYRINYRHVNYFSMQVIWILISLDSNISDPNLTMQWIELYSTKYMR